MQSKIDQHHIGMDFHNCKKRKMQAALNLEGPTFTALYNQVQTALNDHILVSVADNNEYEAIPQPFRASMTAGADLFSFSLELHLLDIPFQSAE